MFTFKKLGSIAALGALVLLAACGNGGGGEMAGGETAGGGTCPFTGCRELESADGGQWG